MRGNFPQNSVKIAHPFRWYYNKNTFLLTNTFITSKQEPRKTQENRQATRQSMYIVCEITQIFSQFEVKNPFKGTKMLHKYASNAACTSTMKHNQWNEKFMIYLCKNNFLLASLQTKSANHLIKKLFDNLTT